jgi:hypothetical protein
VRTHAETGEKSLFVGILDTREASVEGMSKAEGIKFLDDLKSFATQPQFTYTHQWQPGDSILWDNRCTMHRASKFPDANGRRICYRVTLVCGFGGGLEHGCVVWIVAGIGKAKARSPALDFAVQRTECDGFLPDWAT